MPRRVRLVTAVLVALTGIYFGLKLAVFAEKDDSPGGVMIGVAIMFGALSLGLWIALRQKKANPG
jgi:membrane protein DedA with SNARE-associated domain